MTKFSCAPQDSVHGSEYEVAEQLLGSRHLQQKRLRHPEPHLWGYLQHCTGSLTRVDFLKVCPEYYFGRTEGNTIVLASPTISSQHCIITWDGKEDDSSVITVQDNSSNGTYINGKKIGKGKSSILRDGNEISFGTCIPQENNRAQDYRFIFRHLANVKIPEGLNAFYDVDHQIGQGSFGTVMKAISRQTGEWYAIKIIENRLEFTGTHSKEMARMIEEEKAKHRRALAREVAILGKLKHPNICHLKEVFFTGGNGMQLVLEFVDGGDLLDYIVKNKIIDEAEAQHITHQICAALHYIHRKGIVHRDLKPDNILLTQDTPPTVKVADFGLAKAVDHRTMLRTQCGTPEYMAPEVLRQGNGVEGYDHLADSWSLGAIVFCMLTGTTPFDDDNEHLSRTWERKVNWSPLDESNVSEEAKDFIHGLLQLDPEDRMSMTDALSHRWLTRSKGKTRKIKADVGAGSHRPRKQARKA